MFLPDDTFLDVIAATPLVSMDLLLRNAAGELLLGQRCNRPAQGCWFVPGGRVRKNETLAGAFTRLCQSELGQAFELAQARFAGVFQHFYPDSVFGDMPDTHYVVLAWQLQLPTGVALDPPADQHCQYRWWSAAAMRGDDTVHAYTVDYLAALAD